MLVGISELVDWTRRMQMKGLSGPAATVTWSDMMRFKLGRLDLAVYQDKISSLPFIYDKNLRERMRSAVQMVNNCYNIRAGSSPD